LSIEYRYAYIISNIDRYIVPTVYGRCSIGMKIMKYW